MQTWCCNSAHALLRPLRLYHLYLFLTGMTRMRGLRDGAVKWIMSCSYPQLDLDKSDKIYISLTELDPLYSTGLNCPKVGVCRMNGKQCDGSVIGMSLLSPFFFKNSGGFSSMRSLLAKGWCDCSNYIFQFLLGITQGANAWHMRYHHIDRCTSGVQLLPKLSCSSASYFGNYETGCLDKNFTCTTSLKATTQLWFVH